MGDRNRDRDQNQDWNADWNRPDTDRVFCPTCGAENRPGAESCHSCGRTLSPSDQETIIEVTSGDPRIVPSHERDDPDADTSWREMPGGFSTVTFDRGRVIVARGGSRACLITLALFALVSCCVCWVIWSAIGGVA